MVKKFIITSADGTRHICRGQFKSIVGVPCFIDDIEGSFNHIELPDVEVFDKTDNRLSIRLPDVHIGCSVIPKIGVKAHDVAMEISRIFPDTLVRLMACSRDLALYHDGVCIYSKSVDQFYKNCSDDLRQHCCYKE